jgi:hypothetical protein
MTADFERPATRHSKCTYSYLRPAKNKSQASYRFSGCSGNFFKIFFAENATDGIKLDVNDWGISFSRGGLKK